MNYDKNYLCYPFKVMRMTQGYYGKTSHLKHTQGTPKDYPIDEGAEDTGRNYMYCPCDEIEVVKIFNSTKSGQTNVVWYRSTSPVVTPTFTDYIVIMVVHMNDDVLSNLWIGKKFKRWEQIGYEGNDGANAYHFHMSIARGQVAGWQCSSNGAWVQSGDTKKPEECFFIDYSFSKMVNSQWIDFMPLNKYIEQHKPIEPPKEESKPIEQPIIITPSEPQNSPIEPQTPIEVEIPKNKPIEDDDKPVPITEPIKEVKSNWLIEIVKEIWKYLKEHYKGGIFK